jgi:hypothetical protein
MAGGERVVYASPRRPVSDQKEGPMSNSTVAAALPFGPA